MTQVINQVFFVAIGARPEAETRTEEVGLSVTNWAIEIRGVRTCGTVGMTRQALSSHLDETGCTSTNRSYTD